MDKKPPQPAPAAAKAPDPAAKQTAPPQAAPAPQAAGAEKTQPAAATPTPGEQGKDFSTVPVQSVAKVPNEQVSDSPGSSGTSIPSPYRQITVPKDPIDWFEMRKPFTNRGVALTSRDGDQIRQNFTMSYNQMMWWGFGPDLSLKIANFGLPLAYDFTMARDNPTQIEKFDLETERTLAPGKKLGKIVVPIITPDTLSWSVEKLTGKKYDFNF